MSADPVNPRDSHLPIAWSRAPQPSPKFFRLAKLRKLRSCQEVAAICFRIRGDAIEFLLVQTRHKQRWIFPKGRAEPGLTHAQAAALEASEEAGSSRPHGGDFLYPICSPQAGRPAAVGCEIQTTGGEGSGGQRLSL